MREVSEAMRRKLFKAGDSWVLAISNWMLPGKKLKRLELELQCMAGPKKPPIIIIGPAGTPTEELIDALFDAYREHVQVDEP